MLAPKLNYAYLSCRTPGCSHENVIRIRYSWPLPPLFFEDPNFWCQADDRGGPIDAALAPAPEISPGAQGENDGASNTEKKAENDVGHSRDNPNDGASPTREENLNNRVAAHREAMEEATMTERTPSLMHQLSAREKIIYQLYAAKRAETPISIEYSVPVGHEFLAEKDAPDYCMPPDTDPRLYRIDVIEVYSDHIFLIEVKTTADLKAYGQVLAYSMLYTLHYRPTNPVVPLIVFEHASQILIGVCLQDEIPIFPVSIDSALS